MAKGRAAMEVDQLKSFIRVAERENFTRAAEDLGLSQSALSRAIGRLEAELGQPVFERQSRKVTLTQAGTLLLGRAQQILTMIEDAKSEITDDGQTGTIRLAAIPTIAPFFLPGLLKQFSERFPDASVVVQEDTTENTLRRCAQGEIDLAILALPIAAKYLDYEELFDEELLLVLPPDHPLATKPEIAIEDVEAFPFVLLGEAHCLTDQVISFCRQQAFQPISVERTSQLATVQELVAVGHGVSMIPEMATRIDDRQDRVYRSLAGPPPTRRIAMLWNPYRFQSKLVQRLMEEVRSYSRLFSAGAAER
jgi:LysR family hydrogen peroxide-inducible transcriptional activator